MNKVLVVDASSILAFNHYYVFDKNGANKVYQRLFNFLISKIKSGEIIILDKVFDEIYMNGYTKELKAAIKPYQMDTLSLFNEVQRLISENTRDDIIDMFGYSDEAVNSKLEDYEKKHADLFLVAYCIKLKKEGKNPVLITEETFTDDKKIIEKIPTICKKETIEFQKIPQVLFNVYKHELQFELNIISK